MDSQELLNGVLMEVILREGIDQELSPSTKVFLFDLEALMDSFQFFKICLTGLQEASLLLEAFQDPFAKLHFAKGRLKVKVQLRINDHFLGELNKNLLTLLLILKEPGHSFSLHDVTSQFL
eukprot:CAMPEP_0170566752 /NCGR_PEP_ID=MMETSP0211-20121228/80038_1 /TAXON_ID=311385 /ORGANISM="Pseudokeronopsis sp., Strain OXSARD2" /LENGTH=120 /DNA_ID=CAMNT_0010888011 /DNA_START=930 /DNA_END=1292 /DNA_ORIENTATION=+